MSKEEFEVQMKMRSFAISKEKCKNCPMSNNCPLDMTCEEIIKKYGEVKTLKRDYSLKREEKELSPEMLYEILYKMWGNEKATEALEKQIPIEHHHTRVRQVLTDMRQSVCPKCLKVITTDELHYPKYCCWCGQAINWEEKDNENEIN